MKINSKTFIAFIAGIIVGVIAGSIFWSDLNRNLRKTPYEFLDEHFKNYPMCKYEDAIFTASEDGYMIVFYKTESQQLVAAVFKPETGNIEKDFIRVFGSLWPPSSDYPYPVNAGALTNQKPYTIFVWGILSDDSASEYIEVSGKKSVVIKLEGLQLWYAFVDEGASLEDPYISFYDDSQNLLKTVEY